MEWLNPIENLDVEQYVRDLLDRVEWVEANSRWEDTLLIVTSDHETGYITGPGSGLEPPDGDVTKTWKPLVNKGTGKVPEMEWHHDYHTNSLVPLFAKGYGSERFAQMADERDPVRGFYIDNTEIGLLMIELLKERSSAARQSAFFP